MQEISPLIFEMSFLFLDRGLYPHRLDYWFRSWISRERTREKGEGGGNSFGGFAKLGFSPIVLGNETGSGAASAVSIMHAAPVIVGILVVSFFTTLFFSILALLY